MRLPGPPQNMSINGLYGCYGFRAMILHTFGGLGNHSKGDSHMISCQAYVGCRGHVGNMCSNRVGIYHWEVLPKKIDGLSMPGSVQGVKP